PRVVCIGLPLLLLGFEDGLTLRNGLRLQIGIFRSGHVNTPHKTDILNLSELHHFSKHVMALVNALINNELALAITELAGLHQRLMLDPDEVEAALEARFPEMQKLVKDGKTRGDVEFLPDIALQQGRVIGQVIDDLRRGEAVILKLLSEISMR